MNQAPYQAGELTYPWVISPETPEEKTLEGLVQWLKANHDEVQRLMTAHGALLLRGFDLPTPQAFEAAIRAIDNNLQNDYPGTSPRNARTDYVFSASELPQYYPIMQHIEMSFLKGAPRKLFFYCQTAPTEGGETPISDFRRVYRQLDATIRRVFEEKGVRYIRNYEGPNSPKGWDLWALKRWDELFKTTDRTAVEAECARQELRPEWLPKDRLRLVNERPAVEVHPETGEKVWHNHTQVFHTSAASIEYGKILNRQRNWRAGLYSLVTSTMTLVKNSTKTELEQGMNTQFGDGSSIPISYVRHIQDIVWKNMVFPKWEQGDVLAIDNRSTSHGRMPYNSPREILVAWTD